MEFLGNKSPNHSCTLPTPLPYFSEAEVTLQKSVHYIELMVFPFEQGVNRNMLSTMILIPMWELPVLAWILKHQYK